MCRPNINQQLGFDKATLLRDSGLLDDVYISELQLHSVYIMKGDKFYSCSSLLYSFQQHIHVNAKQVLLRAPSLNIQNIILLITCVTS